MILEQVTFKTKVGPIKKGFTINFRPITVITGKQNCGKSLFLNILSKRNDNYKLDSICDMRIGYKVNTKIYHYDSESDNPRLDHNDFKSIADFLTRVNSKLESSHGKTNFDMIKSVLTNTDGNLILLDEPECGITLRNIKKIIKMIEQAIIKESQIIIVSHHPLFLLIPEATIIEMNKGPIVDPAEFVFKSSGLIMKNKGKTNVCL